MHTRQSDKAKGVRCALSFLDAGTYDIEELI